MGPCVTRHGVSPPVRPARLVELAEPRSCGPEDAQRQTESICRPALHPPTSSHYLIAGLADLESVEPELLVRQVYGQVPELGNRRHWERLTPHVSRSVEDLPRLALGASLPGGHGVNEVVPLLEQILGSLSVPGKFLVGLPPFSKQVEQPGGPQVADQPSDPELGSAGVVRYSQDQLRFQGGSLQSHTSQGSQIIRLVPGHGRQGTLGGLQS